MKLYFNSELDRLLEAAYTEGFLDGVKYQKNRTLPPLPPKKIEVTYVN